MGEEEESDGGREIESIQGKRQQHVQRPYGGSMANAEDGAGEGGLRWPGQSAGPPICGLLGWAPGDLSSKNN